MQLQLRGFLIILTMLMLAACCQPAGAAQGRSFVQRWGIPVPPELTTPGWLLAAGLRQLGTSPGRAA